MSLQGGVAEWVHTTTTKACSQETLQLSPARVCTAHTAAPMDSAWTRAQLIPGKARGQAGQK